MNPEDDLELPPLQMAELDAATLQALFTDVELLGEELEVTLKHGTERYVTPEATALAEAHRALVSGEVLGVQLRYGHGGKTYLDTLMRTQSGYRLVRIQPHGR